MTSHRLRLDLLASRLVRDADGRRLGRIQEIRAERRDGDIVVLEYQLGPGALWRRFGMSLLSVVGVGRGLEPRRIPWDRMDLSDPDRPRFLGRRDELDR